MATPVVNIIIEKGTDFESTYFINNPEGDAFNLSNYSASARIKKYPSSPTSIPFSVNLIASTGEVRISMGNTITAQLSEGRNYYDIIITSLGYGTKTKVIEGSAIVNPSASL
jgi:hypothetical protein